MQRSSAAWVQHGGYHGRGRMGGTACEVQHRRGAMVLARRWGGLRCDSTGLRYTSGGTPGMNGGRTPAARVAAPASGLHQGCIRTASGLHQGCIRAAPGLHQDCIRAGSGHGLSLYRDMHNAPLRTRRVCPRCFHAHPLYSLHAPLIHPSHTSLMHRTCVTHNRTSAKRGLRLGPGYQNHDIPCVGREAAANRQR